MLPRTNERGARKFVRGESVCCGIPGCGDVTEVKSRPGFQTADGAQLMAECDAMMEAFHRR